MPTASSITPVLVYSDLVSAHTFLVETLGFSPGPLHCSDDGQVGHGEVHVNGGIIWLHRESTDHDLASLRSRRPPLVVRHSA